MKLDLVIFDCDGVLIDSEPIANRILASRLHMIGVTMSVEEVMRQFVGKTRDGCLALAAQLARRDLPTNFASDWDVALFDAFRSELKAIDGVLDVLKRL